MFVDIYVTLKFYDFLVCLFCFVLCLTFQFFDIFTVILIRVVNWIKFSNYTRFFHGIDIVHPKNLNDWGFFSFNFKLKKRTHNRCDVSMVHYLLCSIY